MPLHDWRDDRGWDSIHGLWQAQLIDWIQPRLPPGYRAYLGSIPGLTVGAPNGRPDVGVRNWRDRPPDPPHTPAATDAPDLEDLATLTLDPDRAIQIDRHGLLVAAVELVSPRNKDRPDSRDRSTQRFYGYLHRGVHLLLIDVLPHPYGFSFADAVATDIGLPLAPTPVPFAVSFRVGEPEPEGTVLAAWRRPMSVGEPLATIPLALTVHDAIPVNLEHTYREAAQRVYLD